MNNQNLNKIKISPVILAAAVVVIIIFIVVAGATLFSTTEESDNTPETSSSPSSSSTTKTELDFDIEELDAMTTSISPSDFDNSDISDSALGVE